MDIVLKVCMSDGSEISVGGFDEVSFAKDINYPDTTGTGYEWQKDFPEIFNVMSLSNFLIIKRQDVYDPLEYRGYYFAFKNQTTERNMPLILNAKLVTTIINNI